MWRRQNGSSAVNSYFKYCWLRWGDLCPCLKNRHDRRCRLFQNFWPKRVQKTDQRCRKDLSRTPHQEPAFETPNVFWRCRRQELIQSCVKCVCTGGRVMRIQYLSWSRAQSWAATMGVQYTTLSPVGTQSFFFLLLFLGDRNRSRLLDRKEAHPQG